jgi:endonuclease YncB( thermonuclease family)
MKISLFSCCYLSSFSRYFTTSTDSLDKATLENTRPFIPEIKVGKVIKVYDGDTITVASKLPFKDSSTYRFQIRLLGIDCPEIKGGSAEETRLAKEARDALSDMVLYKNVRLENVSIEKYGRILATVFCDDIHVNQWMIDNKYAVCYNGGTKNKPVEWR